MERQRREWDRAASILAMLVNINRDPKKGHVAMPDDFNPYTPKRERQQPKKMSLRAWMRTQGVNVPDRPDEAQKQGSRTETPAEQIPAAPAAPATGTGAEPAAIREPVDNCGPARVTVSPEQFEAMIRQARETIPNDPHLPRKTV